MVIVQSVNFNLERSRLLGINAELLAGSHGKCSARNCGQERYIFKNAFHIINVIYQPIF